MKSVAVIGAGAAGCFCAAEVARLRPDVAVTVFEAGPKALAKVAVTGGGRCNFTNSFEGVSRLAEVYPRGEQLMKRALKVFSHQDAMDWLCSQGVEYVIQEDHCVFPASQDAMQIVRTLEGLMRRRGVSVRLGCKVEELTPVRDGWRVRLSGGSFAGGSVDGFVAEVFDAVVVTTGGGALGLLDALEVKIEAPVPSLFTFKIDDAPLRSLMGAVVQDAALGLAGTKFRSRGPLLITDWGVSGPATLRLSSYAARHLSQSGYKGTLLVNWLGEATEASAREFLEACVRENGRKMLSSVHPEGLSERVWKHIISRCALRDGMRWAELGSKGLSRLASCLVCDTYPISGRCRFKEEFVTCGGVALSEVDLNTLESRRYPGLYFAGEVLDVDALTGGFNLQAAWSCAIVVARSLALR